MNNKDTHSPMKAYRLKHIPTGLYWVKKSYGLSDIGTLFTTAANSFNGLGPDSSVPLAIVNDKFIRQHRDVFERVGELEEVPIMEWDIIAGKFIPTGKSHLSWHMISKVSDFEKEYVTLEPGVPEPSVIQNSKEIIDDVTRVLVERVTRACWDQMFSISKDLMPYEDLLKRVKNQLNIK